MPDGVQDTDEVRFQRVLDCLNSAFKVDPLAIHWLMANRMPCNKSLANHTHIQCRLHNIDGECYTTSALGILNGVLAAAGLPLVAEKYVPLDDDSGTYKPVGFYKYEQPPQASAGPS